jgi:hypothetical protein
MGSPQQHSANRTLSEQRFALLILGLCLVFASGTVSDGDSASGGGARGRIIAYHSGHNSDVIPPVVAPRIASIAPNVFSCAHECVVGNIVVSGFGFGPGQTVSVDYGKVLQANLRSPTEILLTLGFDSLSFSPGFIEIRVSSPVGTSNAGRLAFTDAFNDMACVSQFRCVLLDQGSNMLRVFDLGSRQPTLVRSCFLGASLAYSVAEDDVTGLVVVAKPVGIAVVRPDDCRIVEVVATSK